VQGSAEVRVIAQRSGGQVALCLSRRLSIRCAQAARRWGPAGCLQWESLRWSLLEWLLLEFLDVPRVELKLQTGLIDCWLWSQDRRWSVAWWRAATVTLRRINPKRMMFHNRSSFHRQSSTPRRRDLQQSLSEFISYRLYTVSQKMHQLWNGIAQNYTINFDEMWQICSKDYSRVCMFQFSCRFAFCQLFVFKTGHQK